jgi:hypothetical protein
MASRSVKNTKQFQLFITLCGAFLALGVIGVQPVSADPPNTVKYEFSFDSTGFQFDFGNSETVQTGSFTYDGNSPVNFDNGEGFYVVNFNFVPTLSFHPDRDIGWVPEPDWDAPTVETPKGELGIENDQWELYDSNGILIFQLSAEPDGGGFTGEIGENVAGGGFAEVSFTLIECNGMSCDDVPGQECEEGQHKGNPHC